MQTTAVLSLSNSSIMLQKLVM